MSLSISIPKIAITPEEEDDDDYESNLLNLAEALTDVEELFDDHDVLVRNSFKNKLKIKISENDGYNTAQEDVEASDEDDAIPVIIKHECPISIDDIDLEQFTTEENYCISNEKSDHFEYMKLQISNTDESLLSIPGEAKESSFFTDIENYETENELEENNVSDSDIHMDNGETLQITTIVDELQDQNQPRLSLDNSDGVTPLTASVFPSTLVEEKECKPVFKKAPTFRQMMRGKANAGNIKMRKRKRNKYTRKNEDKPEDDSSENEPIKKENIINEQTKNSLNYESDVEEEKKIQFPVCKKTFAKNNLHLKMPEFDINDKTDVEDFEVDVDIFKRRISVDNSLFQEQLDEMASCYSFTRDKNEAKLKTSKEKEQIIDCNKSERSDDNEEIVEPSVHANEVEKTNVEDISKLQFDEKVNTHTKVIESEYDTEEESFWGLSCDWNVVPDIILPPPTRTLVIAEESKSLIPTVRILPLDGNVNVDSEWEDRSTDDESLNSTTEFSMNRAKFLQSPQLPVVEGENVEVSENSINPIFGKMIIEDEATDIEDLDGDSKHIKMTMNSREFLSPNDTTLGYQTEFEDLDITDSKLDRNSFLGHEMGGHTDYEFLNSSDDDSFAKTELQRPRKFLVKLKCSSNLGGHTDTEDLMASSEDDINYSRAETATPLEIRKEMDEIDIAPKEVMYLKGGGFYEFSPEEIFHDEELHVQEVMDAWEYFNHTKTSCASPIGIRGQ